MTRRLLTCAAALAGQALVDATIYASKDKDPGAQDLFGDFRAKMLKTGDQPMDNVEYIPNTGQIPTWFKGRPPAEPLAEYTAAWGLGDYKRTYALIVEDMEKDYEAYIDFIMPNAVKMLKAFRKAGQPVIWTNWNRIEDDGAYGAIDRFYGPRGIYPPGGTEVFEGHMENPMWVDVKYTPGGTDTVEELKPLTADEESLYIKSLHLSKFSDLDKDGDDLLYPMLRKWGVDTVVIIGAWTEDCITATALEATDRYGLDVVVIKDAVGTATGVHTKAIDVMEASCAKVMMTDEFVDFLESNPSKIAKPKAALKYAAVAKTVSEPPPSRAYASPVAALVAVAAAFAMGERLGRRRAANAAERRVVPDAESEPPML